MGNDLYAPDADFDSVEEELALDSEDWIKAMLA